MRIGELAARTGVSVHVLRVWERRYGLLAPIRSPGGYRLYGPSDEWRVRETVRLRTTGLATAQAAAAALSASRQSASDDSVSTARPVSDGTIGDATIALRERLLAAIGGFDDSAAHAALDVAFEQLGVEEALQEVVLPVLHETGERWASGSFTVAQEHFASNVVRHRLAVLALAWDAGTGPLAVLACPPGEQHELGLLAFGVVLGRAGWRVRYLGADTPVATLGSAVEALGPELVVLSAVRPDPLVEAADQLRELPGAARQALTAAQLVIAGAGATEQVAHRLGARLLSGDPVQAAQGVGHRSRHRREE